MGITENNLEKNRIILEYNKTCTYYGVFQSSYVSTCCVVAVGRLCTQCVVDVTQTT